MAPVLKPLRFLIHSTSHPHKHPAATPSWFVYELSLFKQSPHRRSVSSRMTTGDSQQKASHHSRSGPSLAAIK